MADDTETNGEVTPLTKKAIEKLGDVIQAFDLADEHGVDTEGLDTVEEIQQRLTYHLRSQDGSIKEKIDARVKKFGIKDEKKRNVLCEMVREVNSMFPDNPSMATTTRQNLVEDLLLQDGTTDNIREDCQKRITSLQERECVILVAGESSAGKSSLLNLLLGEEILPYHMLPCTSCITVIKYNSSRYANILYKNNETVRIPKLDAEGLKQLQSRAYFSQQNEDQTDTEAVYEQRKQSHDVAEIQVYLPLEMLKSGLVLVDTPGVGETEFLEDYLMQYIHSNQILGFMYIVMADNPLGVAEDRLVNLMSLIVKSQKSSADVVKFNPNAALFVGNRWDMVPPKSRRDVRKNVIKQLTKSWPDFDESNTVFFSTYAAQREIKINPSYITDDYEALLHGISKLVDVSLDKRINATYKWLGTVLQRSVHYLRTMVQRLDMSDQQRQERTVIATKKLKTLQQRSDTVVKNMYAEAEREICDVCTKVRTYLATPQANMKLTKGWGKKEGELPDSQYCSGGWDWIKRHIETAFDDRLQDLLDEWDGEEKIIKTLEKKLFREAKLSLSCLESELADLERGVQQDEDNMSRVSSVSLLQTMCRSLDDMEDENLYETEVPKKMLHRFSRFVAKTMKKKKNEAKLKQFMKSPETVATKKAEKILHELLKSKDDRLDDFVRDMMQRPLNYIKRLEIKIPGMIQSNITLLEKFEKDIVEETKRRQQYVDMMIKVEEIRRHLIDYGQDHFFGNDFKASDIELILPAKSVTNRRESVPDLLLKGTIIRDCIALKAPHGMWHGVYQAKLKQSIDTPVKFVVVKAYTKECVLEGALQETAKLRCLLHSDVCLAEFLGAYQQKDTLVPAYIYSGSLFSARFYRDRRDPGAVPLNEDRFLSETLTGLQYLHSKQMVHMELTKDTITVDNNGEVKLTGACLPRNANLPSMNNQTLVGDLVYLAPEVRHQTSIYIARADVYSFALLTLEMKLPNFEVFSDYRQLTVREFAKLSPQQALGEDISRLSYDKSFRQVLLKCLDEDINRRPKASDMAVEIKAPTKSLIHRRATATPGSIWKSFKSRK